MKINLEMKNYIDFKVLGVTHIKGLFGYRVVLIYMDGSQVVQQKSGFKTKKQANRAREDTIGQLYKGTYIVFGNIRFEDFVRFWLEGDLKSRATYSTYYSYISNIENHILPFLGTLYMKEISRGQIQKLYNSLSSYSRAVARISKTIIDTSMKYALEHHVVSVNPANGVKLPKKVEDKRRHVRNVDSSKTLTFKQIMRLIEASKSTPIYIMILLNVLMGLRRSEIIGVKYSDIDYINQTMTIERQLGKSIDVQKEDVAPKTLTKQEIKPKTQSSERVLPIPDVVFEALQEERKNYEKNRNRRKQAFQDLNYICCSTYGRPRSRDYHFKHFKELLQQEGLPDIKWHGLRTSYCTLLIKNDISPKEVSKLMGHAKEIITVDVYTDKQALICDCVDVLEPYINSVMPSEEKVVCTSDVVADVDLFYC